MPKIRNRPVYRIKADVCFLWATMLFLLPMQWVGAIVISGCFHELCHAVTVFRCGGTVTEVEFGIAGARMTAYGLDDRETFLATLAGPCGELLLVLLGNLFPRLAICALVQSLFNLLPLTPLDGGNMLNLLLRKVCPPLQAAVICQQVCRAVCLLFLFFGMWAVVKKQGCFPLCLGIWMTFQTGFGKIPCKPDECRVQ